MVLAELAGEIASHGGDGEGCGSRETMIERFFLDGIRVDGGNPVVVEGIQCSADILSDPADSHSVHRQPAAMRAQVAPYYIVF
jgi:hypothetical protein